MSSRPPTQDVPTATAEGSPPPLAALGGLPYREQRHLIDAHVEAGDRLPELLEVLGAMRDHEPFAYAVRQMGARRRLSHKAVTQALGKLLRMLPDTGVQRLLGGLSRTPLPAEERAVLAQIVGTTMRHLGLPRLAAFCLMDRWLKNEDAVARQSLAAEAVQACKSAISRSRPGGTDPLHSLPDELLLRVPGAALPGLAEEAAAAGVGPAWTERRQRFATAVLEVLESQPKSLSQANAEEILARRVYTEPGHFLSELLQNAEDAGATEWTVSLAQDEVQVWHDGLDFDARDVVGVLSIGQTTKEKGQIGFFGVGFKSVYEICERPQIYSDVYRFEVADVSIPRRLGRRPPGAPERGTLLCLPLRDPDPRGPSTWFERARAIPPETLLTLSHLRAIRVRQGTRAYEASRGPGGQPHRERITARESPSASPAHSWDYLVVRRNVVFSGGHRESSRAQETPILVALRLGADGRPVPLPEGAATVFSHLPTSERPGYRFLLHAHFDLPIDRERLDLSSSWNRWAIAQAGEALAEAAAILAREVSPTAGADRLEGLLDVLPRPAELSHPAWSGAWESLRREVQALPLLPAAAGGGLRPAAAAVLADARLTEPLATVELDPTGRRALRPLGPRASALAQELGASAFGAPELVALLTRHLAGHPEGTVHPEPWMLATLPTALEILAEATPDLADLGSLPLLPDAEGRLFRPRVAARADAILRGLYGQARPLLSSSLQEAASPRLLAMLEALGVPTLTAASLVGDLTDPQLRLEIVEHAGLGPLLDYLAGQPDRLLAPVLALALFPDTEGLWRPLVPSAEGPAPLWRPPKGPLGAWLRHLAGTRPPLIDASVEASHGALLDRIGAPRCTLEAVVDAVAEGSLEPTPEDLRSFHQALEEGRAELTPRVGAHLARAPLFPTTNGERRPLLGPERALLSTDPELVQLAPEAPWVSPEVASLAYLGQLDVPLLTASELVDALTGESTGELSAWLRPDDPGRLRHLYAFLAGRASTLDAKRLARLASSPLWLDRGGTPRVLPELRLPPSEPALAALWEAWPFESLVESRAAEGMASLACAEALGLRSALRPSDFPGLVEALRALPPGTLGELARPDGPIWPLLVEALNASAHALPRSALLHVADLPLFPASDGRPHALGDWSAPPFDGNSCGLADGPIGQALGHGSRPLVDPDAARLLEPLLDALGTHPADIRALVEAVETDASLRSSAASQEVRRALAAHAEDLGRAFPIPASAAQGTGHSRLGDLPLWPSQRGRLRPSAALVRPSALHATCDTAVGEPDDLLDEAAAPEAAALDGLFAFRSPATLLLERIRAEARPGEPLAAQPPFLAHVERLGSLVTLLRETLDPEELAALPLAVDARGRLVARRLFEATVEEIALVGGLPLGEELALPQWAAVARAVDPLLAPRLPARRVVLGLVETARTETTPESHPCLRDPEARRLLYAWILEHREAIADDDQARGPLGQAHLFPNRAGLLVSPRQLLFDPALPEVFAPERPAEELPAALLRWLEETFPLEDRLLDRLVDHLVALHEEAARTGDGDRSVELLAILARLLGLPEEGPLPELPRRLKLHRRIRVETTDGSWAKPKSLLAPDPDHGALVEAFLGSPPPRASARYRPLRTRRLLGALGAADDLRPETLLGLLEDGEELRPGLEAGLALARYLARRVAADPPLAKTLGLGERRFIPDGLGTLRRPSELAWPSAEARSVLGARPECYPHPEFFLTVPRALAETLPFRPLAAVPLGEVVESLRMAAARGEVPEAIFEWLDSGLASRRVDPRALREALAPIACLPDAQGVLRRPVDVFRVPVTSLFGARRGHWVEAHRFRRLSDALGIPQQPGRRDLTRFLGEVTEDARVVGPEALARAEPELLRCLPRCLALLAELGDPLPSPVVLTATDLAEPGAEVQTLCLSDDDRLCLPEPRELAVAARAKGVSLRVPLFRDQATALTERLGRAGCPPLGARFTQDPLPAKLPDLLSGAHAEAVGRLSKALTALGEARRDLPRSHPSIPVDRWRAEELPTEILVVGSLMVRGVLAGVRLELALPVALDRTRLLVTSAGLADLDRVAEVLTRERLLHGFADPRVVASVAEILETGWVAQATPRPAAAPPKGRAAKSRAASEPEAAAEEKARAARDRAEGSVSEEKAPEPDQASSPPRPPRPPQPPRAEPLPERAASGESLLGRFRRWLKGDDAQSAPKAAEDSSSSPSRGSPSDGGSARRAPTDPSEDPGAPPPSHGRFFRPRDAVGTQLGSARSWLRDRDRPPAFGFAFAPSRLPLPYLYAPSLVADRFEPSTQRWRPSALPQSFDSPSEHREGMVALEGRVPAGEILLPLPLYGRVDSLEGPVRVLESRPGRLLCSAEAPTDLSLGVSLGGAPRFDELDDASIDAWARTTFPPSLLAFTVPDDELPDAALSFAAALATSGATPLERALGVRSFVRDHYRYDPSYLEDPELAHYLAGLARGRANAHLALLHAGRDARHLGAGVCYELGVLTCELLRRVEIPAAVATGWTLDRGRLDDPDHLWAMALLPSTEGARWLPVDSSTTREGRPLHASDRPSGPWRAKAPRGKGEVPASPKWSEASRRLDVDTSLPLPDLLRVARHVEKLTGLSGLDEASLRRQCSSLLSDPEKARALLDLLRSS